MDEASQEGHRVKLRIVTATRGESVYWRESASSVAAAASEAEHIVICPAPPKIKADGKVRVIVERNTGLYAAVNQGANELLADWEALTWINDDDRLLAPGFARLTTRFAERRDVGIAFGRVGLIDGRGVHIGELPVARRTADLLALLAQGIMPLAQPGTVIRRDVWEKLGGLDESFRSAGDLDFFVRALMAGVRFEFFDACVAEFRLSAGQLSKNRAQVETETRRALAPLGVASHSMAARWRFRLGNLRVYLERLRRHGFVSMRTLYDRTE